MTFSSLNQNPKENIQDYLVRLRSSAPDCEFVCPSCNFDISNEHIKDQFICGLYAEFIQTDILAKAGQLKALDDVIKHLRQQHVISKHFKTLQRYWQQDSHTTKKINKANTTTKDYIQDAVPTTMVKRMPTIVLLTAPQSQKDKAHAISTSIQLISVQSIEEQTTYQRHHLYLVFKRHHRSSQKYSQTPVPPSAL